jgi:murein L,D-transpeptidase YcbB/YkuD
LALERWRWLPLASSQAHIVANIPEFRLRAYDKDFHVGVTMNIVVGNAFGHDTPIFADTMKYVIFRPYWEVPPSIIKADLIPHIRKDPYYLAKKKYEIVDSRKKVVTSGRVSQAILAQLRAGKLFVRQLPGPTNSLGLVKFVFPNSDDIYMHDTPSHELFAKSRRDFSHGCIRLEKPAEMAAWVLRDNPGWDPARIRAAMDGSAPLQVNLTNPTPVLIFYVTVVVLEDGLVHFYDDIYHHDEELQEALAKGYPYPL